MVDDKVTNFKVQVLEAMSTLSAFGLVAALAWNEAIKALIKSVFGSADDLLGMLVCAMIVTILAVFMTILITKSVKKAKVAAGKE